MKRVLPIVAAGGALYYYDQNVDPIISRHFQKTIPEKVQNPNGSNYKVPQVEKSDIEKFKPNTTEIQKGLESKFNQLENKTSELTNKFTSSFTATKEDLKKDLPLPNTSDTKIENKIREGVASYFDSINSVGDKIVGKSKEAEAQLKQDQSYNNAWFSWGTGHKEKLSEAYDVEKARSIKRYEVAKQKLDEFAAKVKDPQSASPQDKEYLKQAQRDFETSLGNLKSYGSDLIEQTNKELEKSKNSWFNWGSKQQDKLETQYEQEKSKASKQYESAKKYLDDLTKQIQQSNPFKTKQEQDDHLKAAQDNLSNSFENLKKYGSSLVDNITK